MHAFRFLLLSSSLLAVAMTTCPAFAQAPGLRGAVPDEAIAVVEMADPAAGVRTLLQAIGGIPPGLKDKLGVSAWAVLGAAWVAVEGDPVAFAHQVAGGGAVLVMVPTASQPQSVLLLRPTDLVATERWCVKFAAKVPRQTREGVVVLGSDAGLVASIAARVGGAPGRWAQAELGSDAALRGAIDLAAIRRSLAAKSPTFDALDAGAKFLLLPLAHAVTEAEQVTFAIGGGERLTISAMAPTSVRATPRGGLLPPEGQAFDVPLPADGLGSLRLDRSVRALLQKPERFLQPAEVLAVQGFLSIADAIDGARTSFVDDLLGGLGEPFTLLALPITAPVEGPPPRLQLPGFAMVARITNPKAETVLLRVAEAFGVIANVERAQRNQPTFPLRLRRSDAGRGLVGEPSPWRGPGAPPIELALSPTVWIEGGHAVLASTYEAAMAALVAVRQAGELPTGPLGDRLVLRGPAIGTAIAASRSVFELGRVLDEGEEPASATRYFDVFGIVAASIAELTLSAQCDATQTTLVITVERAR